MSRITAENYTTLAKAFVLAKAHAAGADKADGYGFAIAVAKVNKSGTDIAATPRQWGAWRAWFRSIGYARMAALMDGYVHDKNCCLTVPAEWPHLFDPAATVQGDHDAGERFARNYRPERIGMASLAQRQAAVAAYRSRLPRDAKRGTWAPQPEAVLTLDDIAALKLKTPAGPASPELRRLLAEQRSA